LWKGIIIEENFEVLMIFIFQNWGECVDTIFGHVSLDAYLELMRCRSADKKVVTSSQKSCR